MSNLTRRSLLAGGVVAAGTALGGAFNAIGRRFGLLAPDPNAFYNPGATLTYGAHRVFGRESLAREFPRDMISAKPFANEMSPLTNAFKRHQAAAFTTWQLAVHGHVAQPRSFSVADLRAMGSRSQITEVTCEEGWSYIAEWTGTPLSAVLQASGVQPTARYVSYFSSDPEWWDAIDIDEAMHSQTLLTWGMNGSNLPVPFGGPLRMRVPRQLGYKSVKFINRLVVTDSLDGFPAGASGYAWYAGA